MDRTREQWKRNVQKLSAQLADQYGFIRYRRTFLVKVQENICLSLCFDFPPGAMRLRAAAQPVFIPEKAPNLSLGRDIKRPNFSKMGYWGKLPQRYDEDIAEIEHQIATDVIPFFNRLSSPQKLVSFLNSRDSMNIAYVICPPIIRKTYLAYSYLYLKEYPSARGCLEDVTGILSAYSDANSQAASAAAGSLLSLIDAHEYGEIDRILNDNMAQFRTECGI